MTGSPVSGHEQGQGRLIVSRIDIILVKQRRKLEAPGIGGQAEE